MSYVYKQLYKNEKRWREWKKKTNGKIIQEDQKKRKNVKEIESKKMKENQRNQG